MKYLELFFLPGLFGLDFTCKNTGCRLLELLHPFVDERLMDAKLGAEFGNGFLTGKGSQSHPGLERRGMIFSLGYGCSPLLNE